MKGILKNTDKIICNKCNKEQDDYAEDYVVVGQTGHASKTKE